jgi:aldose 1-epimerase
MGQTHKWRSFAGIAALGLTALAHSAFAAEARLTQQGTMRDGTPAEVIDLSNGKGVSARILAFGATLQSLIFPDRLGRPGDVVLGHDTPAQYEAKQDYFGATIGRYANRIARGTFVIDGKTYRAPLNNGENTLHGGGQGFDRQVWHVGRITSGPTASVELSHVSPDGAMGYPGELRASVTYALADNGDLTITFVATTTKPTIVNMTNHALFNMAGHCASQGAMSQRLTLPASRYTPVDRSLIPTGEFAPVAGTVFDFRQGRTIADGLRDSHDPQILIGRGYDHNWVLDKGTTKTPVLAARLEDPVSGRAMEVLSTEPGLQMYTGNFIDGTDVGKGGCLYRMGDGIALEPQRFPDAPNQPAFGASRLEPGETYRHVMILRPAIAR